MSVGARQWIADAVEIGNRLLRNGERDENGLFWQTITLAPDMKIERSASEQLYSGNGGIALFLIELYGLTGDRKFARAAEENLRWVVEYCRLHPPAFLSGITGRMSVIFPLLRMTLLTGNKGCLEDALEIGQSCREEFANIGGDDLLNGTAGILLAYLHLHAATGATWIVRTTHELMQRLVDGAHPGPHGWYWDRSGDKISGLCGFSHGNAGVAFTLMEAGWYFGVPALNLLARRGLAHETAWFERYDDWPDLRKSFYTDQGRREHMREFLGGNHAFFCTPGQLSAWCHGAPGIGFARIRAWSLTREPLLRSQIELALNRVEGYLPKERSGFDSGLSFNLCHGYCGVLEFVREASHALDRPNPDRSASALADAVHYCLKERRILISGYPDSRVEDESLFMGTAGIGYFLLRLADPQKVPSILVPRLPHPCKTAFTSSDLPLLTMDDDSARRLILEKSYPRTLHVLEYLDREHTRRSISVLRPENDGPQGIATIVEEIKHRRPDKAAPVEEIYALEGARARIEAETSSLALLEIKGLVRWERLEAMGEMKREERLQQRLILEPAATLMETGWDWSEVEPEKNLGEERQECYLLLLPAAQDLIEESLSLFTYLVLKAFDGGRSVAEALSEVTDAFEIGDLEERARLEDLILNQIEEALKIGALELTQKKKG